MNEEKLENAGASVWLELRSQLNHVKSDQLKYYVGGIISLLDYSLIKFTNGDNLKRINEYERFLNCLRVYVDILKDTYEIQR